MSEGGPELTADDVKEILRLIDEAGYREFELETPRLSIRVNARRDLAPTAPAPSAAPADENLVDVVSPSVGTFYRAPSPGAPPFVEVGTAVEADTQVCILEVMKLMNAVVAGTRGVIAEVCRENADSVEYGDVLFRIRARA